jgi:excisionase family DNA binding protein
MELGAYEMTASKQYIETPNERDVATATASSRILAACVGSGDKACLRVFAGDEEIEVPVSALRMLQDILSEMSKGNAISIVPIHAELTTQEAADFLNVSRPYFIKKILEAGLIPFHKVGVRRKVKFTDLVEYKRKDDEARKAAADELAAEARRLDLGY